MESNASFPKDVSGATAVEYGLLIAFIAAVIAVSVGGFGGMVLNLFDYAGTRYPKVGG